jgi:methionyl-tRNA formyltransferase
MVAALAALDEGRLAFTPQAEEGVTYAHKIDKAEAQIDWARPARAVHDLVRALSPFPGAYFEADLGKGQERVKVLRSEIVAGEGPPGRVVDAPLTIACSPGALRLLEVQRAGKAPMQAEEFQRGARLDIGTLLASL